MAVLGSEVGGGIPSGIPAGPCPPIARAILIVNPASRRGGRLAAVAERAITGAGVTCDTIHTERPGHAAELARQRAAGYDAVFTLGGDGTAMEVVGALGPGGPPVGILAGGTGNLLARALGIPLNTPRAVRTLLHGEVARIDLGRLGDGRRFAIGVGVGIDASMIADTPAHWKRRIGVASYVLAAARSVFRLQRFTVRVTVDGEVLERRAAMVLVTNFGALLNNLITLGDGIRYDDGVLNVCLFDPETFPDAIRIARKLVFRDFRPDPMMAQMAGKHILVETDIPRPAQADGDLIAPTPFVVDVEPLAGCLIVPQRQIGRQ